MPVTFGSEHVMEQGDLKRTESTEHWDVVRDVPMLCARNPSVLQAITAKGGQWDVVKGRLEVAQERHSFVREGGSKRNVIDVFEKRSSWDTVRRSQSLFEDLESSPTGFTEDSNVPRDKFWNWDKMRRSRRLVLDLQPTFCAPRTATDHLFDLIAQTPSPKASGAACPALPRHARPNSLPSGFAGKDVLRFETSRSLETLREAPLPGARVRSTARSLERPPVPSSPAALPSESPTASGSPRNDAPMRSRSLEDAPVRPPDGTASTAEVDAPRWKQGWLDRKNAPGQGRGRGGLMMRAPCAPFRRLQRHASQERCVRRAHCEAAPAGLTLTSYYTFMKAKYPNVRTSSSAAASPSSPSSSAASSPSAASSSAASSPTSRRGAVSTGGKLSAVPESAESCQQADSSCQQAASVPRSASPEEPRSWMRHKAFQQQQPGDFLVSGASHVKSRRASLPEISILPLELAGVVEIAAANEGNGLWGIISQEEQGEEKQFADGGFAG
ncbi:hypothetical protein T484DRAFT_1891135 [Baffinella frigidus]|nr:hypothetical protein T484DRAFT_1891135 [Cryptophyta sp. CCMP2293]